LLYGKIPQFVLYRARRAVPTRHVKKQLSGKCVNQELNTKWTSGGSMTYFDSLGFLGASISALYSSDRTRI
jgi:hypothetical protein